MYSHKFCFAKLVATCC